MLKFKFIWAGHTKEAWLAQGIEEYLSRIKRYHATDVVETKTRKGKTKKEMIRDEGTALCRALPPRAFNIALDERGKMLSSTGLASLIGRIEDEGRRELAFVIGGAYGLSKEVLDACSMTLSLSPMTFTHDMARLILAEQVYRACTIRAGTAYHHAGKN